MKIADPSWILFMCSRGFIFCIRLAVNTPKESQLFEKCDEKLVFAKCFNKSQT